MDHPRRHAKLIFLMLAGAISIVFLMVGVYQTIEFMDSTTFCGRLCHNVMYPEYTAHQASPHSQVECAECHVGRGADYLVRSKLSGVPLIFITMFGTYDRPIPTPVKNLRPARDICEQCHQPGRFSGDLVRTHTSYKTDEQNTQVIDSRILRIGAGEKGVAQGIHWHIGANVWYLPLDEKRLQIGWVGVYDEKNELVAEYIDPEKAAELIHTDTQIIEEEKRQMDCLDCHTRITHIFESPENLIDSSFDQGKIDRNLPYIKREGLKALDPVNSSLEEAYSKVESVRDFYAANYPDLYVSQGRALEEAITQLKEIARLTTFPFMKVDWNTYIDNIGHSKLPGCFRCHGKVEAITGPDKGKVLSADCTKCHYVIPPSQ